MWLTNPHGFKITFKGIKKFCRENNLGVGYIFKLINNERTEYKGWKRA